MTVKMVSAVDCCKTFKLVTAELGNTFSTDTTISDIILTTTARRERVTSVESKYGIAKI